MNESDVVEQLVNYTNLLLAFVSVLFTVVSAYIAALNYFIGSASIAARFMAFLFVMLILAMLAIVMIGAQFNHAGLIARLYEIQEEAGLSAAGRAVLANSAPDAMFLGLVSIDDLVRGSAWGVGGAIVLALFFLTFIHRWRPEESPNFASKKAA